MQLGGAEGGALCMKLMGLEWTEQRGKATRQNSDAIYNAGVSVDVSSKEHTCSV